MSKRYSERDEIIASLSKRDRKILWEYEIQHGRVFPGAIYKIIEDQKELIQEKNQNKRGKR